MKKLLAVGLTVVMLLGCASQQVQNYYMPAPQQKLFIYTSHKPEVYGPIVREFEDRTGIWVQITDGGTSEMLEMIAGAYENGQAACNVMFGGGVESLSAYGDCFEPYICEERDILKEEFCNEQNLWTPFSLLPMVIICNSRLVAQGEVTGWSDLLDEKWRGRIAFADPTVSGSSYTAMLTMFSCLEGEPRDIMSAFLKNIDGKLLPDSGDVIENVKSGAMYIGVTMEETALKNLARGTDISIVYPKEGTSAVPDGVAIVKGAKNGESARLFLDFVQGYDVQSHVVADFFRRSVRADIEEPHTLPPQQELGIIDYDVKAAGEHKEEFAKLWGSLIGGEQR